MEEMKLRTFLQILRWDLAPFSISRLIHKERTNGGEFTIHPIAFMITLLRNWLYYAFSKMHPITSDGDADAVIVTISGEE